MLLDWGNRMKNQAYIVDLHTGLFECRSNVLSDKTVTNHKRGSVITQMSCSWYYVSLCS